MVFINFKGVPIKAQSTVSNIHNTPLVKVSGLKLFCFNLAFLICSFPISIASHRCIILISCKTSKGYFCKWKRSVTYIGFGKHFLAMVFIKLAVSTVISLTRPCFEAGILSSCSIIGSTFVPEKIATILPFFSFAFLLVMIV